MSAYVELLPPGCGPDDPRWHELRRQGVSASEVAAVLGISPWQSPFSVYWQKVNGWATDGDEIMNTGSHLEASIAEWWAGRHPDVVVRPAGLYASAERPWQLATPDRLVRTYARPGVTVLSAVLECKWVVYSWDGWGTPGTDQIPVYYRAQVLQQIDVMGVDLAHVAALGPDGFREYGPIRRDEKDLRVMRASGEAFMRRIKNGDAPDLDAHHATLSTLRALHPSVGDYDVEVPVELAEGYRRARALRTHADKLVDAYEARIRAAIGDGRRAVCGGRLVASRSVYEQSGDTAELTALEGDWPTVDRLNPGRAGSYE